MAANQQLLLPPLSPAAPGPLYQQIIDGLKGEIAQGRLAPGSPLPSVRALAEDLLVSVITVKRAYEELEHDGIIYRKQGLGTFVAENGSARSLELKIGRAEELLREALREAREAGMSGEAILKRMREIIREEDRT